jgi:hypothetical protein
MSHKTKVDGVPQPDAASSNPPQDATAPQPQAPPQVVQQVQYVKMEKSQKGVAGWLLFFLICFVLSGLGMLSKMIYAFFTPVNSTEDVIAAIFAPLIFASALAAVVFIALQFRAARFVAITAYAIYAIYAATALIASAVESGAKDSAMAGVIIGVLTLVIISGLLALYFVISRRVKETLVKPLKKNLGVALLASIGGVAVILLVLGLALTLSADKPKTNNSTFESYGTVLRLV